MRYFRAYLAVFLWTLVIFMGSTDLGSSHNTSRLIGPILRWLKPDISDATIKVVQAVVRKSAHMAVYGVLAALAWRAQRIVRNNASEWRWREFRLITIFCLCYAISDELHQSLVASRQGSAFDVMFDTFGAVAALLAIRFSVQRNLDNPAPASKLPA